MKRKRTKIREQRREKKLAKFIINAGHFTRTTIVHLSKIRTYYILVYIYIFIIGIQCVKCN